MSREPDLSPEAPHVQNVGFWNERHGGDQPSGRRKEVVSCPRGHQGILAGEQGPGSLAPDVPLAVHNPQAELTHGAPSRCTRSGKRGHRRGRRGGQADAPAGWRPARP